MRVWTDFFLCMIFCCSSFFWYFTWYSESISTHRRRIGLGVALFLARWLFRLLLLHRVMLLRWLTVSDRRGQSFPRSHTPNPVRSTLFFRRMFRWTVLTVDNRHLVHQRSVVVRRHGHGGNVDWVSVRIGALLLGRFGAVLVGGRSYVFFVGSGSTVVGVLRGTG